MQHLSGSLIESQVDYLTASAHGKEAASRLLDLARGLEKEEKAKGNRPRRWRLMGYEGTHAGAIEYGSRDEAASIIRLAGQPASTHLAVVLSVADTVTRVDLAATWRCEPPDPMHGRNAYHLAEAWYREQTTRARPSLISDADGGNTLYVGHRESEYFLRVYNKEVECRATGDDEGADRYRACWRYELEAKGPVSGTLAERVNVEEDPASYIQSYLYQYARAHGLEPPFPHSGAVSLIPGFRRRSDADSKLRHIRKNVRPTADWLRQEGHEENLREALGFDRGAELLRELQRYYPDRVVRLDMSAREGGEKGKGNHGRNSDWQTGSAKPTG